MAFGDVRAIDLSRQVNGSQLVARVHAAAAAERPVRIKLNQKLVEKFNPNWGELIGAVEACEKFDRCCAVVEQRLREGGKVTSVTHWLWISPDGGMTAEVAVELGRIRKLLEGRCGSWQHAVRSRTIQFKSTHGKSAYPSLELLHRIRNDGLPDGDPRAATMVFVATHAGSDVRWEVRLRPL